MNKQYYACLKVTSVTSVTFKKRHLCAHDKLKESSHNFFQSWPYVTWAHWGLINKTIIRPKNTAHISDTLVLTKPIIVEGLSDFDFYLTSKRDLKQGLCSKRKEGGWWNIQF